MCNKIDIIVWNDSEHHQLVLTKKQVKRWKLINSYYCASRILIFREIDTPSGYRWNAFTCTENGMAVNCCDIGYFIEEKDYKKLVKWLNKLEQNNE